MIREKGLEKVTVDMLVTEITPKARCKFQKVTTVFTIAYKNTELMGTSTGSAARFK